MRRYSMGLWLGAIIVLLFMLFEVSYKVQGLEAEIASIESQIREEQETLHVLEAEWAYLTRPTRLQMLSSQLTDLRPMRRDQLVSLADIPSPHYPVPQLAKPEEGAAEGAPQLAKPAVPSSAPSAVIEAQPVSHNAEVSVPAARTAPRLRAPAPEAPSQPSPLLDKWQMIDEMEAQ